MRRLADGTLALGHDAADHTAPTLREVLALAAAKPGVRINCDLKERGLEPAVAALAAECGMSGRLILSGSVDVDIFAAHPELHDCAEVYLNIEEYVPDLYLNYRNIPDFELTAAEIITARRRAPLGTENFIIFVSISLFRTRQRHYSAVT